MGEKKLIISVVVGYMLKVLKKGLDTTKFKDEFSAIRHGDYDSFIKLVNVEEPTIVSYNDGKIKTNNFSKASGDCDFVMLIVSGPALKEFFNKCKLEYDDKIGIDTEIDDTIYEKLAEFEISLRMHSRNNGIDKRNLVDVIDMLCFVKVFDDVIKDRLHKGRDYINYIKHGGKKFSNHSDGINKFNDAFSCLIENNLVI